MEEKILRRIFNGFIYIHILEHAKRKPFYGTWMIEHLKEHGYSLSPGTLYPILREMESTGIIVKEDININGKIRKYYSITEVGEKVLTDAREKLKELKMEF
ncbi:PadR family transcriptional regulator [Romboutsia sp.]|uniref:PadR family transcriptional regulator n=1 Tax=Romboutsia sp. TaxID=1965302 RepID=UPI002BECF551|nr:PadR family transcriptional regulator [Romboutsia sp.]HSQ89939.1 PadR family transcriptional regulator [Romboutsia sp.]